MAGDQSTVFLVLVTHQGTGAQRFINDAGVTRTWLDPAEAAAAAKELNDWAKRHNMPDRYRVIKEGQEKPKTDWRERERQRFQSGKYLHAVWYGAGWAVRHVEHYCHVALDDPRYVAYTPDAEAGEADKQLRITPDGYLRKYFSDCLGAQNIRDYSNEHLDKYGPEPPLLWAHTADEFVEVYTKCHKTLSSCMTHDASYFSSSVHPVRVYGAGDLALAYIMAADGENIAARVLCWPAQKRYSRIYGRERRLRLALQRLGYTEGNFNGARLLKIEDGDGLYVCPYVDYHEHVALGAKHLIINGADGEPMRCDSTDGRTSCGRLVCYACGDRIRRDQEYRHSGHYWCETCYTDHFTYCEGCREDVDSDDITVVNGDCYCSSCYSEQFVECHECGEHTERNEAHEWRDYDYCEDCYTNLVTTCETCNERVARDDAHEHNDQTLCPDCHTQALEEEQAHNEPELFTS